MCRSAWGKPLTIYGNKKKGLLNILDTLKCVELAIKNPAKLGEFSKNQFTEVFSIKELALLVQKISMRLN